MTSLGTCGAFTAQGKCNGHLIVDREFHGQREAVCDRCGAMAALPVGRMPDPLDVSDGSRDEQWWQR